MARGIAVFLLVLGCWLGTGTAAYAEPEADPTPHFGLGTVRQVAPGETPDERIVTVDVTSGDGAGRPLSIVQATNGPVGLELDVKVGDRVVLAGLQVEDGGELDWQIVDFQRALPLGILVALTALLMLLVGGWRGIKTIAVLGVTFALIAGVLLPFTLKGVSPLPLAVAIAALVALATTLLTSGASVKSWSAVLGTTGAMAVAAILAAVFTSQVRLTGLVSEEGLSGHTMTGVSVDFAGLLAASMLVGALGVMLDLALSIAAAVDELRAANPDMSRKLLFRSGKQVGKDLLSTTSNTLLLAYLGSFLPLLLMLGSNPPAMLRIPHLEPVAAAATTLLVGLLGLIAVIPITAGVAAMLGGDERRAASDLTH